MATPESFSLDVDQFIAGSKQKLLSFATEFIQDLNQQVVERTPVNTGFLRGSWYAELNARPEAASGGGDKEGVLSVSRMNLVVANLKLGDIYFAANGAEYAVFVEFGTRPHDIRPKDKMALHWDTGFAGGKVGHFAKVVHHPGTPAFGFVRATLDGAGTIAEEVAQRVAGFTISYPIAP